MKLLILFFFAFGIWVSFGWRYSNSDLFKNDKKKDIAWIKAAIVDMENAFNSRQHSRVLQYFDKNILVSYPNIADTRYADFSQAFAEMSKPNNGFVSLTRAKIDEILVSGDYGFVRMDWNTTIKYDTAAYATTRIARDFQVWERQKKGGFKFIRGMWFRNAPNAPPKQ